MPSDRTERFRFTGWSDGDSHCEVGQEDGEPVRTDPV